MARSSIRAADLDAWQPAPVMNTTPLIDLMLVLLVMFIVSVPIATHKVPLDVGAGSTSQRRPIVHRLEIDAAGALAWDGRPISGSALAPLLAQMGREAGAPELHIAANGETRYERVDEVLAAVARAGITRTGFVGNERFAATLDSQSSADSISR